ncbi:hypothetical protein [Hahella sp. CCB-MM4]|uniref:hypothetical protein n=1 Tax=Hahella sp. (strain CCB-MM4) TaxID=1926491 RepID=UPI00143D5E54|nr:hypothetical protein [Hahella sp. CCB-MM4]
MNKGQIKPAKTVKAGCGIRFDPDQLSEETSFDFSKAKELLSESLETKKNPAKSRVKR